MGLCKICQATIFGSSKRWGYHREDYYDVKKDPELKDCTFCADLGENNKGTTSKSRPKYHWTLRWLPATRQDQPCIVVTFRPLEDNINQDSSPEEIKHAGSHGRFPQPRVFYLFKKDSIKVASHLGPTTEVTSEGSLNQIQEWMHECTTKHERCQAVRARNGLDRFVPKRLVDVSGDRIHIVESNKAGLKGVPYVTLSHCWGKIEILQLIQANTERLLDPKIGIEWDELTDTFREAITVTRKLGVKYIWIDSLCIVQWSSKTAHGDFHEQGQLMHKVYRQSFCNIAAADSENGNGGLFRPRPDEKNKFERKRIVPEDVDLDGDGEIKGSWYILPGDYWSDQLLDRILYTRGWVFQERMLAPRLIHFSKTQVLWDCTTLSASEVLPRGIPPQLDTKSATERHWRERLSLIPETPSVGQVTEMRAGTADDSLESFWRESVRNYTRCDLTNYVADKLKGIWGVAKLIRDGLRQEDDDPGEPEEYGAGLWRKHLYMQLAWRVVNPRPPNQVRPKDLGELHPSWSWASTIAEIELQPRHGPTREICYRVTNHDGGEVEFEVVQTTPNLQPELASKSLAVKGSLVKGYWDRERQMVRSPLFTPDLLDNTDFFPDDVMGEEQVCYLVVLWAQENVPGGELVDHGFSDLSECSDHEDAHHDKPEQVIHNAGWGLMLSLADRDGGSGSYRRIGAFKFQGLHKEEMGLLVDEDGKKDLWIL